LQDLIDFLGLPEIVTILRWLLTYCGNRGLELCKNRSRRLTQPASPI
jgi:hypothetical protein